MERNTLPTDLRRSGKVFCITCHAEHNLSDLRMENVNGTNVYVCDKGNVALVKVVENERVLPIIGTSII